MLGPQFCVIVHESHDLNNYRNIYEHFKEMLQLLMDRYQLDNPDFITIRIKTLHLEENIQITKQNLSNIELHKGIVKVEKMTKIFGWRLVHYI
jgi:hypothetical protein